MADLVLRAAVPVELDRIVDGRTVVHELALDDDEHLQVGDHVALRSDRVSLVAVITVIDADGTLHIALR